jgi:hypothetical protein
MSSSCRGPGRALPGEQVDHERGEDADGTYQHEHGQHDRLLPAGQPGPGDGGRRGDGQGGVLGVDRRQEGAEDGQAGQPADSEQQPVGPPTRGGQHQDHGHDGQGADRDPGRQPEDVADRRAHGTASSPVATMAAAGVSRRHPRRVNHPVRVTCGHPRCRHHVETAVAGSGLGRVRVPREGGSYEIRVRGRLSDSLVAAFEGMNASVEPVETVLHGPVQDQAALYGLLDRIQALGLELLEVRRLPDPPAGSSG